VHDPLGLHFRRRFTMADGEINAYLDETLDDERSRGRVHGHCGR